MDKRTKLALEVHEAIMRDLPFSLAAALIPEGFTVEEVASVTFKVWPAIERITRSVVGPKVVVPGPPEGLARLLYDFNNQPPEIQAQFLDTLPKL